MRWIVLLRAVNVGGTGKITMADLRQSLGEAGGRNVASYIQSGNLLFDLDLNDAKAVADWTAGHIQDRYGFRPGVIALPPDRCRRIVDGVPFPPEADPKMVHLGFFQGSPAAEAEARLQPFCTQGEQVMLRDDCLYLHTPNGIGRSRLNGQLERALGVPCTLRNLNSARKILSLA